MVEVKKYYLPPTPLIPNNPRPLLHYPSFFEPSTGPAIVYDQFASNGWEVQWIFRYGQTQTSHYHSRVHECMAVLTGTAKIRFGVADTSDDLEKSTYGTDYEDGGVVVDAKAGDVFVIPAGVAHKTHETLPKAEFVLLTPGDGHGIDAENPRKALEEIKLDGFTMVGAYPRDDVTSWDFAVGESDEQKRMESWTVPKPELDPVLGGASEGICGQWH